MVKKFFSLVLIVIMSLGLLVGCQKTMRITDFDGLKDLPNNPNRIVFGTNSMNYNEETGLYGDPTEYELKKENLSAIAEMLFHIPYEAYQEDVAIDPSPIIRYLIFYNEQGNTWKVDLGLRRHNDRYYYPINDKDFITFLYESITN